MSILTPEEISTCEKHLRIISDLICKTQEQMKFLDSGIIALSQKKIFLRENFPFIGEKIVQWFLNNKGLSLNKEYAKLEKLEKEMRRKNDLYQQSLAFLQSEAPENQKVHELLVCLAQLFIDYRITSEISAQLWEMKNSASERAGIPIKDIDRKTADFIRGIDSVFA